MSALISEDMLNTIIQRSGLNFNQALDLIQAKLFGFVQKRTFFNASVKANKVLFAFPQPDQRFIPKLPISIMRVDLSVSFSGTAPVLKIRTYDSQNTKDEKVLNGAQFVTTVSKSFDKQVNAGEKYNFIFDQDCTIDYMKITEIPIDS